MLVAPACGRDVDRPPTVPPPARAEVPFEETIHLPDSLTGLQSEVTNIHGEPVSVACATCHDGREVAPGVAPEMARHMDELDTFHSELQFEHGSNTCGSCHDEANRNNLRMADGTSIEMTDAIQLCAQCHGPQYRDYSRGSHGGMNGHWDLHVGPRERNHCVDCHDPHVPAYPEIYPLPGPRDRFMEHSDDH